LCWRGYVDWKENGEWVSEDCGCFGKVEKVYESGLEHAEFLI